MARNRAPRPYTGRQSSRPLLIVCLLVLLMAAFLVYTYRTNEDFRAAVESIKTTLCGARGEAADDPDSDGLSPQGDLSTSSGPHGGDPDVNPHANPDAGQSSDVPSFDTSGGLLVTLSLEALQLPEQAVEQALSLGADGVVVDLKLQGGVIAYLSSLEEQAVVKALSPTPYDLKALCTLCREKGLTLTGRLSTFSDHLAGVNVPGACVAVSGGVPFLDGNYQRSLDPYREQALSYLALLTDEVSPYLDRLLLADVAFPSYGKLSLIAYPGAPDKSAQLLSCIKTLQERAGAQGAKLWVELPYHALTDADYAAASGQTYLNVLAQEAAPPAIVLRLPAGLVQRELSQAADQIPQGLEAILLLRETVNFAKTTREALSLSTVLCEP